MLNFYYQVGYSGLSILILGLIAIFMAIRGTVLVLLLKKQGLRPHGISQQIISTIQDCERKNNSAIDLAASVDPTAPAAPAVPKADSTTVHGSTVIIADDATTAIAASAIAPAAPATTDAINTTPLTPHLHTQPNRELLINTLMQVRMKGIYAAMYYLKLCAAIGPLLGLLGTVLGMVDVFSNLSSQTMPDPRMLAGGIWEALLTTVMGLSLAIPSLIVHYFLLINLRTIRNHINLALSNLSFPV